MFGQDHPVAAGASRMTSTCGAGAHAPSGPPWTSTIVGSGSSPAPARRGDPRLDRAARPGRLDASHLDRREPPLPGDADASSGSTSAAAARPPSRSIDRAPSPGCRACRGPRSCRSAGATASVWVVASDHGRVARAAIGVGGRSARPVAGSSRKRTGCDRPRSVTVATIVASSSQSGPCRPDTIQPLRSVSIQLPIGRSRSARVDGLGGAADPSAGPTRIARADVVERVGPRGHRWPRPSGRRASTPGGWPSRRGPGPRAARRPRAFASTSTAQIVVRGRGPAPGRGPR